MAVARTDVDDRAARRVEAVLRKHHAQLLWVARRWSGSADDAEDALQRTMEIYVRRLDSVEPETEFAWLKVVIRHEAMAVKRARVVGTPLEENDLAEKLAAPGAGVDERVERDERLARSLEALARIKPDERTALLLKAEGFSYREIGERLGWTYTKVNRAITEGRRRFMGVIANIESGAECERFAPMLMALVRGGAEADDVIALRPHLRHCATCRATVRELHASRRHRLVFHLPLVAGIAPARWLGDRLSHGSPPKPTFQGLLQRLPGSDLAAGVQLASSGGGRGPAVATLLGLCLSGGAGTYCLATGALPDPTRVVRDSGQPNKQRAERQEKKENKRPEATAQPTATTIVNAIPRRPVAPEPTATPQPVKAKSRARDERSKRSDPQEEFGFESVTVSGDSGSPAPAAATTAASSPPPAQGGGSTTSSSAPPTSGGEFLP